MQSSRARTVDVFEWLKSCLISLHTAHCIHTYTHTQGGSFDEEEEGCEGQVDDDVEDIFLVVQVSPLSPACVLPRYFC